jgi:hypothetical protein
MHFTGPADGYGRFRSRAAAALVQIVSADVQAPHFDGRPLWLVRIGLTASSPLFVKIQASF